MDRRDVVLMQSWAHLLTGELLHLAGERCTKYASHKLATLLAEQRGEAGAADFLSSIELCVVTRCEVVVVQT